MKAKSFLLSRLLQHGRIVQGLFAGLLLGLVFSCSSGVMQEEPATESNQIVQTKAGSTVVEFIADSVVSNPSHGNNMCVDIHGNMYYLRQNPYESDQEYIVKYDDSLKHSFNLFSQRSSSGRSSMCVTSEGNIHRTHYAENVLYKYNSSGILLRDYSNMSLLSAGKMNLICDADDNVYAIVLDYDYSDYTKLIHRVVKIAKNGKVTLVRDLMSQDASYFDIYKPKGNFIYTNGYHSSYSKLLLSNGEISTGLTGIPSTRMSCGMNDAGIFLLSYNTIHRFNPNTNQVIQKAVVPLKVINNSGEEIMLSDATTIFPTPDGDAAYVLCYRVSGGYPSGVLIKLTW